MKKTVFTLLFLCALFPTLLAQSSNRAPKAPVKIVVVVNKNWETEPVLHALTTPDPDLKANGLPYPTVFRQPIGDTLSNQPRAIIFCRSADEKDMTSPVSMEVHIYCLQDMMYLGSTTASSLRSSSSSQEKDRVLRELLAEPLHDANLVIAVGTAGHPYEGFSNAGSVVVGGTFFMVNGNYDNPKSRYASPLFGNIISSNVHPDIFHPGTGIFTNHFKNIVTSKFIPVPNHAAEKMVCLASPSYCAVSFVNVTDYAEYGWADHEAVEDYEAITSRQPNSKDTVHRAPVGSIETTHGIIRGNTSAPTIFVSAITDNLGFFNAEVTPSQNYAASFNAGVVLGQLLVGAHKRVLSGKGFSNSTIK